MPDLRPHEGLPAKHLRDHGSSEGILLRESCFDRKLLPLPRTDVVEEIGAADLVGELQLQRIEVMDQRAGNVIKRREAGPSTSSDQHGEVLGVRVRAADQPVEHQGARECPHVFLWNPRVGSNDFHEVAHCRAALILILLRGHQPERLAEILLMQAPNALWVTQPIIAFDDNRHLVVEAHNARPCGREYERSRQREAQMLVFGMAVEGVGRRLQDMRRG